MLIVKVRESRSVQKRLLTLVDQDSYKIVKLYSPQTEGNTCKDCEAHRCVDFLQSFFAYISQKQSEDQQKNYSPLPKISLILKLKVAQKRYTVSPLCTKAFNYQLRQW